MGQERITLRKALPVFEGFSENDFCDWIEALLQAFNDDPFLAVAPLTPHLDLGAEEVDGILVGLHRGLRGARGQFADAIATLYESTPYIDGYAERIYLLLQVVATVRPRRLRNTLRANLLDELAFNIQFTESQRDLNRCFVEKAEDLHTLLLSVAGEYGQDESLLEYIRGSAEEIKYHPYLLVCFRLLAASGDSEAFAFLETILPHTHSYDESGNLALEVLEEIKRRTNYRQFCKWYTSKAVELSSSWPEEFRLFEDAFHQYAFPEIIQTIDTIDLFDLAGDKYRNLVAMQLHAQGVRYTAEEVLRIARLYEVFGKDQIIAGLHNIWRRASAARAEIPPWEYITVSEFMVGSLQQSKSNKREIEVAGGGAVSFDATQEPILDEIFEQLNTIARLGAGLEEIEQELEELEDQGDDDLEDVVNRSLSAAV